MSELDAFSLADEHLEGGIVLEADVVSDKVSVQRIASPLLLAVEDVTCLLLKQFLSFL